MRVDFAGVFDDHLFVYGWILGLFEEGSRAEIRLADLTIDLLELAIAVPRPDVAKHFAQELNASGDMHGFCLMVALPPADVRPSYLRLGVSTARGRSERVWPVKLGQHHALGFFEENPYTFNWLLENLPPKDSSRLRALAPPAVETPDGKPSTEMPLSSGFGIHDCLNLQNRLLLVLGWREADREPLTSAKVRLGASTLSFLNDMVDLGPATIDENMTVNLGVEWVANRAFFAVIALGTAVANSTKAIFEVSNQTVTMRVRRDVSGQLQRSLASASTLLGRLEGHSVITVIERLASKLDKDADRSMLHWLHRQLGEAVARLPGALQSDAPPRQLHIDHATPIADAGVFVSGWYSGDGVAGCEIFCHSGFARMRVDDSWIRMPRPDVSSHLETLGISAAENDLGFLCYVPLPLRLPCYLSIQDHVSPVRYIRLDVAGVLGTALQTARSLLTTFGCNHPSLRQLLNVHVGPAIEQLWTHRSIAPRQVTRLRFGPEVCQPQMSVIVPLYGRSDLAEYQMALFADDPDFQTVELIYFVDDPRIYDEFNSRCRDLFEIYRVPFTVAFTGSNLGFAGANNCAAQIASGQHLLLLNSDVMPKQAGWTSDLLEVYRTLEVPGLLGARLLYEDGSVQHVGMTFRRHSGWDGMWINAHLQKGQSASGLAGTRKAEAVTAACVLIDAALYESLGGLSEDYIIGDFEDSDLCLRAEAAGRVNYVALDIELFHLERQSQDLIGDAHWRTNLTLYNCWLHDRRWAAQLEQRQP